MSTTNENIYVRCDIVNQKFVVSTEDSVIIRAHSKTEDVTSVIGVQCS